MNYQDIKPTKVNWKEVFIFYVIAVGISAPFRLNIINLREILPLPYGLNIIYNVFRGIGPLVGFLFIFYIFKTKLKNEFSFFGLNQLYSILSVVVILVGLTIIGVNNDIGINKMFYGFIYGIMLILYSLGEEYGWRGYLQQALKPLPFFYRILLIAILWYIWHLNFLVQGISYEMHVIHFLSLVLGSWGLFKISETTYSLLFSAAIHLSFNIFSDVDCGFNGKLLILSFSAIVWIILIRKISKQKKINGNSQQAE